MSVDNSKINYPVKDNLKTIIHVPENHFLMTLAQTIPWQEFADLVIEVIQGSKEIRA